MESILGAIGVLAIVIFVHELGHFAVAKWCDVEVIVFSLGFGPTVYSKEIGETTYRLALIPFGGYVRMAGQDDGIEGSADEENDGKYHDPARGFAAKSVGQRAAIVAAGPGVNFIFAFLVFAGAFFYYGDQRPSELAEIGGVVTGAPAETAGLKVGDIITDVDGETIDNWEEFAAIVQASGGRDLALVVQGEDGASRTVTVSPETREQRDRLGEVIGEAYMIGIQRAFHNSPVGFFESIKLGAEATWGYTVLMFQTLGRLFQGRLNVSDLGGPIMIAQEAGRLAKTGLQPLLGFMAFISINLGVINVLPIPVLDGGHLFFFLIEVLQGRPLSIRFRELAQQLGVFLLLALMVFVVFNDISRIVTG